MKLTLADINARIVKEWYLFPGEVMDDASELSLMTICFLKLDNGFIITGESACVDPSNFNKADGVKYARQQAIDKLWPILGFELKTKIAAGVV